MRVERLFSSAPLRPAGGVYDPGGADATAGALSAARVTSVASQQASARIEAAQGQYTRALVGKDEAQKALGREASRMGQSLTLLAEQLHGKAAARRQRTEIENQTLALLQQHDAALEKARQATGPDGAGLEARYTELALDGSQQRLREIADPRVRQEVEARFVQALSISRANVRIEEARDSAAFHREQLAGRIGMRAGRAILMIDPRDQRLELQAIAQDLAGAVEVGSLDFGEAARRLNSARELIRQRVIEGWSRNDPAQALDLLDQGAFEHLFADDAEKAEVRRALAGARDGLGSDAVWSALLQQQMEENSRDWRSGGAGDAALAGDLAKRGSAGQRRAFDAERKIAALQREMAQQIRYRPQAEVWRQLSLSGPADAPRVQAARRAAQQDALAWAYDPAAMAAGHPAGGTLAGRIAVQLAKGVPAPALFTRAEAAATVAAFDGAPLAERQQQARAIRRQAGAYLGAALRDLGAAGLPFSARLHLLRSEEPVPANYWQRIALAEATPLSELRFEGSATVLAQIDAALPSQLLPYLEAMAPALEGAGLDRLQAEAVTLARKLALSGARDGQDAATAVRHAVGDLFAERYLLVDGLRIPRQFDAPAVTAQARRLRDGLPKDFAADPAATGVALADGETAADWRKRLAGQGRFATMPDDRGAVLLTPEGLPVRDADGRELRFAFDEVLPDAADDGAADVTSAFEEFHRRLLWSQQAGPMAPAIERIGQSMDHSLSTPTKSVVPVKEGTHA